MKNKLKLFIILTFIMCLCGCGDKVKEPITPDKFQSVIEKSFTIYDIKEDYSFAKEAYMANYKDSEITMLFVKGTNTYDVRSVFADEVANVLNQMSKTDEIKTSKGDNWERLVASNSTTYHYLIRIDDTYLISKCKIDSKNDLKKILKEYGYR